MTQVGQRSFQKVQRQAKTSGVKVRLWKDMGSQGDKLWHHPPFKGAVECIRKPNNISSAYCKPVNNNYGTPWEY